MCQSAVYNNVSKCSKDFNKKSKPPPFPESCLTSFVFTIDTFVSSNKNQSSLCKD